MAGSTLSRIVNGQVMHRRRHPVEHRFVYPVFCLLLNTAISGNSRPMTNRSMISALVRQPLLTLGVMARIHLQALRLWLKGVSLHPNPSSSCKAILK